MAIIQETPGRSRMPNIPNIRVGGGSMITAEDLGSKSYQSWMRLGQSIQGAGQAQQEWAIKKYNEEAETDALLSMNSDMEAIDKERTRLLTLTGSKANEAPQLLEEFTKKRADVTMGVLKTPLAKDIYDRRMLDFNRQNAVKIDENVVKEQERSRKTAIKANINTMIEDASMPGGNSFAGAMYKITALNTELNAGEPPEVIARDNQRLAMSAIQRKAAALSNQGGSLAALAFLNSGVDSELNKGLLSGGSTRRDTETTGETPESTDSEIPSAIQLQFSALRKQYMEQASKEQQDALERGIDVALANGADSLDLTMTLAADYGQIPKETLTKLLKNAGVSEKEAAEFADGQFLTDQMELSGMNIIREAYQGKKILPSEDAQDLKLRLVAEAGWAPEIAERVVTMPRIQKMAKNANEVQSGLDAYAEIRKAVADSNGNIQGTELWNSLSPERQTFSLAMQEQMARQVDIDDLAPSMLYGVLKSRRNADAGQFYQWMNNEPRMMQLATTFRDKPELLQSLMSGQPIDPEKIPSTAALSLEVGELMAGENALGKKIKGRVGNSVDALMVNAQKPERDTMKAQLSMGIASDLMNAVKAHKTSIDGLSPVERDRIINDGLLRYSAPDVFNRLSSGGIATFKSPVYGNTLNPAERSISKIEASSLPAGERVNMTAPAGNVSMSRSVFPDDAGAMVRVEYDIDLLNTPSPVRGRIQHSYGLRNDLTITQQLDSGVFVVVPPVGGGMVIRRDGSVVNEVPETKAAGMRPGAGLADQEFIWNPLVNATWGGQDMFPLPSDDDTFTVTARTGRPAKSEGR